VVAGRLGAALLDVGNLALQQFVEVVVHRERPHALAAVGTGFLQQGVRGDSVREHARIALRERGDATAGQRRIVDDDARLLARGESERIG
jgi:hypothetical protein